MRGRVLPAVSPLRFQILARTESTLRLLAMRGVYFGRIGSIVCVFISPVLFWGIEFVLQWPSHYSTCPGIVTACRPHYHGTGLIATALRCKGFQVMPSLLGMNYYDGQAQAKNLFF